MAIFDFTVLDSLEPIASLSAARKKELAALCFIETVNQNIDPLRMNVTKASQAMYLIKGHLELRYDNNKKLRLRAGTEITKYPVNVGIKISEAKAITDIQILRVDLDLLDIMMTWDQLSKNGSMPNTTQGGIREKIARNVGDWMADTTVFSAFNLQSGIFSHLPAANVEEMFKRMETVHVTAGQVIIQQGAVGDYYYLIQSGVAEVTRVKDASQPALVLAELVDGSAFGEEALVSDTKRNATVTMKTDGELLRLNKKDFLELLKEPVIQQVNMQEAQAKVNDGAVWADVRLPAEYAYDHIEGAINLPLNEIRQLASTLDKGKEYILYCQSGRRSMVGAFVLAQTGVKAFVLSGGM